jgi:FKBP-type peptidyl-prolyl cis-trans isomerase
VQLTGTSRPCILVALLWVTALAACSQSEAPPPAAPTAEEQEERDSLYALGSWLARNLAGIKIEEHDLAPLEEGLADALLGRPLRVDPVKVGERVQVFLNERRAQTAAEQKRAGAGFVEAAKQEPGAQRTVTGLVYRDLVVGGGASPQLTDRVKIHYRGTLADGKPFERGSDAGKTGDFTVNRVIPCWMESLQRMKVGGKARVTCISDLAYGDRGLPGRVLPGAPLQFELELLEILPPEEPAS